MSKEIDALADTFMHNVSGYHEARPPYPTVALQWLLPRKRRIALEIGSGSGLATRHLVKEFARYVCVEPSLEMITVARLQPWASTVEFIVSKFEDAQLDIVPDLVLAAQSLHWVSDTHRAPRIKKLLAQGGVFGAIWNYVDFDASPELKAVRAAIISAYPAFAEWPEGSLAKHESFMSGWLREFRESWSAVESQTFRSEHIELARIDELLATMSWWKSLSHRETKLLRVTTNKLVSQRGGRVPIRTTAFRCLEP